MKHKLYLILFIALLPQYLRAQELTVKSFALAPMEIIPQKDQRRDLNNQPCALIKVQVVDNIDRVQGNLIGNIENHGTEKWLYVTEGSKLFRLFPKKHLPVDISISDYNIPKLEGNRVYILRLTDSSSASELAEQEPQEEEVQTKEEKQPVEPVVQPVEQPVEPIVPIEEPVQPEGNIVSVDQTFAPQKKTVDPLEPVDYQMTAPSSEDNYYEQPKPAPYRRKNQSLRAFAGVGFNALSAMGPSLHLGLELNAVYLEAAYVIGLDKVNDISFTKSGDTSPSEIYNYSCSKFWLRAGFHTNMRSKFQVEPQVGASFNMISGKDAGASKTDYFKKSNPMSLFVGLRFAYEVTRGLCVHLTPQYDFALSGDDVFTIIKTADSKIKSWGEGFGVNAGLLYHF